MLYTDQYKPKKIDDLIGNDQVRTRVRQWILNWLSGKRQKALLLSGSPGIGKTALACVVAKEYDLDLIEMNASELRNKKRIEQILQTATMAGSLTGAGKLILIDDVDALQGRKDFGGASAISKVLKECAVPIILTVQDAWDKKIASIRSECEQLDMKRVSKASIKKYLETIAKEQEIDNQELLDQIAENSNGDVRSALNDLQAMNPGARDREKDIFNRIRLIFKAKDYAEAKIATEGDIDYNLIKLWIDENIPNEYEKKTDLALAYNWLSRADIFEGRIRMSQWKYLKYAIALSTIGVSLAKDAPYNKFTKYSFPSYLKLMSQSIIRRAMRKKIGLKIGLVVHANSRESLDYLPLIKDMCKDDCEGIAAFYEFDDDELAFILETSPRKVSREKK